MKCLLGAQSSSLPVLSELVGRRSEFAEEGEGGGKCAGGEVTGAPTSFVGVASGAEKPQQVPDEWVWS